MKNTNDDNRQIKRTVIRTTLLFFILSIAWILLSDRIVAIFIAPGSAQVKAQTVKGILFVAATTVLVFWLSKRAFAHVADGAQAALARRTEMLFTTVMAHLGEAVILVGPPRRTIVGCNSAVEAMLGYSEEELVGETTALIHTTPRSFELFATKSETVLEQQQVYRCEYTLKHKNGHPVPVEITIATLHENPGWKAGVISIIRDMSSQRKAEEDLQKSEARYRLLAENALDLIWEMTPDLVFTYVNPAITGMIGYTPAEFIGSRLGEHVDPEELKKVKQIVENQAAKGPKATGKMVTTHLLHKNGTPVPIEVHGKIMFGERGQPLSIQGTARDITQRRALEAELRQSQKLHAIGTFAGGIAHEINSPITGISGFAEIISTTAGEIPKVREYCSEIQQQTERVHSLIQNLLGYARSDEENAPFEEHSLHDIVDSTVSLVHTLIRHDKIHLNVHIPDDLPPVVCRRQQVQQVVMNLVTNARDALNSKYPGAHENKRIDITGGTAGHDGNRFVRLTVEDRGSGLPDAVRERIFEPFFTTKPEGEGTGLGMWIIHRVIEEHNGHIHIETAPGEFTRIHIDLPAAGNPESKKRE